MAAMKEIPYKIYLEESEMPQAWYNVRADMNTKHDPLLHPGTGEPAAPGGTEDPGTGEAVDPVTDEPAAPDSGGETAPDGDVTPDTGAVVDPGTGESPAPDSGTGTADTGSDVEGPAAPELPEDGGEDSEPPAWLGGDNG